MRNRARKYIIFGETPSKKNSNKFNSKTKCVYKNKTYKEWYEKASAQIITQNLPNKPFESCVIFLRFYHGDLIRRDSDNGATSILDLLKDFKIIQDDNWKIVKRIVIDNLYEKGNARVEITIDNI